jgi:hypothetical protein
MGELRHSTDCGGRPARAVAARYFDKGGAGRNRPPAKKLELDKEDLAEQADDEASTL